MRRYELIIIFPTIHEIDKALEDRVYEATGGDCTLSRINGKTRVSFTVEAISLQDAIADVAEACNKIDTDWRVELDDVPPEHRNEVDEWLRDVNDASDEFGYEWACSKIDSLLWAKEIAAEYEERAASYREAVKRDLAVFDEKWQRRRAVATASHKGLMTRLRRFFLGATVKSTS